MLCKNCNINDATIHLYNNLNGKQQQVDLCHNCYQIMKTDPNNAILRGLGDLTNPNNMDPFSEFFNHLGGYPGNTPAGKNREQTPPTQAGEHNGRGGQTPPPQQPQQPNGLLEEFGINVTEIARRGILIQ